MNHVKVKVELLIPVEQIDEGYIADAVSAILTENLATNGVITDWQYQNGFAHYKPYKVYDDYHEGEAFEV